MYKVLEYIKYRWKSKGRHGTHSPFVYDFVDRCLRLQVPVEEKKQLSAYIKKLSKDSSSLSITDLGAGSKKMGAIRKVKDIAKNSSSKGRYGKLLYQIAAHYQPKLILELGTSLGIGSSHLHLGNPVAHLVTVEGCPETHAFAQKQLEQFSFVNIEAICSDFTSYIKNENRVFDLIYLDGHHVGDAVLNYLYLLEKNMHAETCIIVDDIYWSESMYKAWQTLKSSPDYHCTMDLFRLGIILKRPHQEKEHFIVKLPFFP